MFKPTSVVLGDWEPDLSPNDGPGLVEARNVIPARSSYREFPGLSLFSNALDGAALGAFWTRGSDNIVYNFAADATKLYLLDSSAQYQDVSQAATTYSASFWDWVAVKDRVIATDGGSTDLQYFDAGTSTEFADLPGTPPRFKTIAQVRDFVIGGNWTLGIDAEPGGYAWSGFNNTEIWTPALATQSNRTGTQGQGGQVQRIISGSRGIAFHESSIRTITYIGPPVVLDISEPIVNHGITAPRSVGVTRQWIFYLSTEGFMQLNRQTLEITPIGAGKVNNWFTDEVAGDDIVNVLCAVDRRRALVFWAFRTTSLAADYDRILVYNWIFKRWSYAIITVQFLAEYSSISANLDTLDTLLGGNIDTASIPVDTDAYVGGVLSLMAFNSSNQACTFNGPALQAILDTAELDMATLGKSHKRLYANGARPIVNGTPSLVEVAPITRDLTTVNPTVGNFSILNSRTGIADYRKSSRYLRNRVRITGGFDHVSRLEVYAKARGSQ